jgi:hypothetical protein
VFNDRRSANPVAILAGRQVLFGKAEDVWRRGEDIEKPAEAYDRVMFHGRGAEIMDLFGIQYLAEYRPRPFILNNRTQWQYFDVVTQLTTSPGMLSIPDRDLIEECISGLCEVQGIRCSYEHTAESVVLRGQRPLHSALHEILQPWDGL